MSLTIDTGKFLFEYSILEIVEIPESPVVSKPVLQEGIVLDGDVLLGTSPAETFLLFMISNGSGDKHWQIRAYFKDFPSTLAAKDAILSHIMSHMPVVQLNRLNGFVKAQ